MMSSTASKMSTFTPSLQLKAQKPAKAAVPRSGLACRAERASWAPGSVAPAYLDNTLAGDFGFDPMGLGSSPTALKWYRQAELVHSRWAMLGVFGIVVQELVVPDVFWYEAALPENLPSFVNDDFNLGSLLGVEFLLMHYVEVRRWQDYKKFGSVNEDPIFSGNVIPNPEMGYPGGIFNPFGFAKEDLKGWQEKEIINGRLAMIAFVGFTIQAQALGEGPLACVAEHISDPFSTTVVNGLGKCVLPSEVIAAGVAIPTPCLWPGN
jgi:light-harvesting complex I chlorophyll a/b binding protein 4